MASSADPDFGKVLLEQKPNKGNIGNGIFLMVLGIPMTFVVAAPAAPLPVQLGFLVLGFGVSGFAAIMLWRNWMHVFLQEFGIREYRQRRGRSLPYDQVDEVRYSTLRVFGNGSYVQTVQKLALKSNRLSGPPLVCTLIFKEADGRTRVEAKTPLTDVRDCVSLSLADRFMERIGREDTVEWTPEVRIGRQGLELADCHGGWEFVDWQRVGRWEVDEGTFRLWVDDEAKPRFQASTADPNFYPAFALALRLQQNSGKRERTPPSA